MCIDGHWANAREEKLWRDHGEEARGCGYIIRRPDVIARPYYYPDDLRDYDILDEPPTANTE